MVVFVNTVVLALTEVSNRMAVNWTDVSLTACENFSATLMDASMVPVALLPAKTTEGLVYCSFSSLE